MSFRSRPVLDRKHRPRWQDELRTQQLTIAAFALAIALAIGIFGAAAWSAYWESHFRPVAAVAGTTYDRADLDQRQRILSAETIDQLTELQGLLGGPRDQIVQQQIDSLSRAFSELPTAAAESLVDAAVLRARAQEYGIEVSEEEVDAAVAERMTHPELVRATLILVVPEETDDGTDEESDDGPTEEQLDAAREEAEAARERVEDGEDFASVATDVSDDFTAQGGGALGAFGAADPAYGEYFEALADAEVGELVGPVRTDRGFAVLELTDRREASTEDGLEALLEQQNIDDATYRDYVRAEMLVEAFREYFETEVVTSPAPQRRMAQIFIAAGAVPPVPQERARHVLISPDPEGDPAEATDEQWNAALEEAREVEELLRAEDADWSEIAEERSDDPGSGVRGGDLGWYDPAQSPFVAEFAATLAELEVGEISEPIRTQFGWHIIQKTGERDSPQSQAIALVDELRADPDSFADVAARVSEDAATAAEGGELGWVAPYQLSEELEDAVFELGEVGEISDPIETPEGITIYRLLETSESREVEEERLDEIHATGFERWLDEVRAPVRIWIDPQYASSSVDA